jgi:imidazolonepropionase-like amidohydrolase
MIDRIAAPRCQEKESSIMSLPSGRLIATARTLLDISQGQLATLAGVSERTISREEALIALTRANAAFLFQEGNLGSLAPDKYADLWFLTGIT